MCDGETMDLGSFGDDWILASANQALAGHGEKRPVQKAILLVAFGTSDPEAQKTFGRIEEQARKAFPGVEIRWAYTSGMIRKKLAREGKALDSPEVALARLMETGFTHVAVLSLHTIPGEEFHELHRNAHLFGQMEGGFEKNPGGQAPPLVTQGHGCGSYHASEKHPRQKAFGRRASHGSRQRAPPGRCHLPGHEPGIPGPGPQCICSHRGRETCPGERPAEAAKPQGRKGLPCSP